MELIIVLLIIGFLYVFRRQIQVWILGKILQRIQRSMTEGMQGQGQRSYSQQRNRDYRSGTGQGQTSSPEERSNEKVDVTKVDALKFTNSNKSDEYVDFEEEK